LGRRRGSGRRLSFSPSRDVVLVVVASLVIGGPSFLYVWQGAKLQQLTAERESARAELTQLEEINHSLELRVEEGFSLQRLSRYAIGQLGMAPPAEVDYVHVPKSVLP
jgi:cell division protein FtsL